MKLAYVTKDDPMDLRAWSGLVTYILKSLIYSGLEVMTIGDLKDNDMIAFIKGALYGRIFKKTYYKDVEPSVLKGYASQVKKALASTRYDVVFSPKGLPTTYLQTEKPIVFWHDATFAGLLGFYPGMNNLCAETIKNGNKEEQLVLSKCRLAIYSSEWAAGTAIQNYSVDPAKVKVVPFGANIETNRNKHDIQAILDKKDFGVCNLLFIGTEWLRKGGDLAVKVADQLNQRGLRTKLHVVGCYPPAALPDFVKLHGFISKASEAGQRFLDELFSQAHFFILPTHADCTPVVFPEACSFGLPILTTNVGGIPTVIKNGKNGQAFPLDGDPAAYCDYIEKIFLSRQDYEQLAMSSFQEYVKRLNWTSAGRQVSTLIQEFCA
jgi:glycosyltransferase involved in cell wall biosynthesis